jgi:CRISPR-associated protein Csb1
MPDAQTQSVDLTDQDGRKKLLESDGPVCLIVKAHLHPVADMDRFQPAGFPEIGHVIYDAPRDNGQVEKVCIVDSPASMANHLEAVCMDGAGSDLHPNLAGLPYVRCVTDTARGEPAQNDPLNTIVCTSLSEGHRLASDYFLDGLVDRMWVAEEKKKKKVKGKEREETVPAHWNGTVFRERLRSDFGIVEVAKDETYFIPPETWWSIYQTVFMYDPNSLVHGVLFAREQIKISRFLTGHHEALGASRVGRSGVKFDHLGKTISGQPIFAVDEETARDIRATFILDLALLRSYGRGEKGLSTEQKGLLLDLALWKIGQLLQRPFKYRTGCFLMTKNVTLSTESQDAFAEVLPAIDIGQSVTACHFGDSPVTDVYYPADKLYKPSSDASTEDADAAEEEPTAEEAEE